MTQSSEAAMKPQAQAPWEEIAAIVGTDHLRPATRADAVDGILPAKLVEPGSAEETAKVLACAGRAGLAVIPRGGGTKLDWGAPPRRCDLLVSTARLDHVLEHAWADMTATVEAGCTVARFQELLAKHGQRLALDPLWPARATIGGILATDDSGALRARFGSLRDLIIGITLALPDGTLAKSGGKVVKNVAGYDLPKLATGSLGTLAVITQAVFRLHPLPHEARTVTFSSSSVPSLCDLALALQASQLAIVSVQLRVDSTAPPELDVRFEGTRAGIESQEGKLNQLAGKVARVESPPSVWNAREELWRGDGQAVIAKFSVLPTKLADAVALVRQCAANSLEWRLVAQALGVGQLRLRGVNPEAMLAALIGLRAGLDALGGSLVLRSCPRELKSRFDVWGPPGDSLPLMRSVKQQLDPAGMLNPGRFIGGI